MIKKTRQLIQVFTGLLSLLTIVNQADAQGSRYFRITGPAASTILSFRPDGAIIWSNALAGTNYTVQTATTIAGGTNWVDYVQIPVTNQLNTNQIISFNAPSNMAFIPAGSFTMGDGLDGNTDALPLHSVYVSAFYMDKTDVTYAQWQGVYNWAITHGYSFDNAGSGKAANFPVQATGWYDCVKWCNARSEMEGRKPAYYTSAAPTAFVYRTGRVSVDNNLVKWNAGYRLPTEAEWEKAARGGLRGKRFPWGNTISGSQANYQGTTNYSYDLGPIGFNSSFTIGSPPSRPYTSSVGSFSPNGYGLYDMAGNVFQWCWDWYGSYGSASQNDPRGMTTVSYRVFRGGDWYDYANLCETAFRNKTDPGNNFYSIGFHSVLPPGQ